MAEEATSSGGEKRSRFRFLRLGGRSSRAVWIIGSLLCTGLGAAITSTWFSDHLPQDSFPRAWELLEEARFAESRAMAARMLSEPAKTQAAIGEAAFLIGRGLCGEAANEWNEERRLGLNLIASRYLLEAYHQGFPPGREQEGLYYLAVSTFEAKRPTPSLPFWRELSELEPIPRRDEVYRHLVDIYLGDPVLDPTEGLEVVDAWLSYADLSERDRRNARLDRIDLLHRAGRTEEALQQLGTLSDKPTPGRGRLIRARILLTRAAEAEAITASEDDSPASVQPLYEEAIIELLAVKTSLDLKPDEADEAKLLASRCYAKLGDLDRAEQGFAELRRRRTDDLLGCTAGLEEANSLFLQADVDEAVERYASVLDELRRIGTFDERWITLKDAESKLSALLLDLVEKARFEDASALARAMWPPLNRAASLSWQAKIHQAWGQKLLAESRQPQAADVAETLEKRRRGFEQMRFAGDAYSKLARLERATEQYEQHLLNAAEAWMQGQEYMEAIKLYEIAFEEDRGDRAAWLLLKLGEAQLADGKSDLALKSFERCMGERPNDPETYLARLAAAKLHLRRSDLATAKQLLLENLENSSLTPQSREWRDSLLALAETLYREAAILEAESRAERTDEVTADSEAGLEKLELSYQAYQQAIRRLNEAVRRYGEGPEIAEYRYMLAEAHRRASHWPRLKAQTVSVAAARTRLEELAREHTRQASTVVDELLTDLARRQDEAALTEVERGLLRNCQFAKGDLFFDLEMYPEAIDAYSSAANRYNDRPECLEAFVRMATCYRKLGRISDARAVLEQAKLFLTERIPDTADFSATTRHSKAEWGKLLDLMTQL